MFKRVRWVSVGAVAGAAATVWSQRKVRDQIDQLQQKVTAQHALDLTKDRLVELRDTVTAAVRDGRAAQHDAERELRGTVEERWGRSRAASVDPRPIRSQNL